MVDASLFFYGGKKPSRLTGPENSVLGHANPDIWGCESKAPNLSYTTEESADLMNHYFHHRQCTFRAMLGHVSRLSYLQA